jgi:uncharacterized membrane protein
MVDKDSEPDDESNKNDYQTNKVFNSGEQKPKSILWNFLGIIGGLLGYWLLSILIAAVLAFVAIYIACGGEFGIKW